MRALLILTLVLMAGAHAADLDALRKDASAAAAAGETDKAVGLYRDILEEAPEDGAIHYQLANALMDNGVDLDEAARHYRQAGELGFQPMGVAYRLARIHARRGKKEAALRQLESLADGGFGVPGLIEGEADFDSVSDEPRFEAALQSIRGARYPCESNEKHHAFDFWIGEWDVIQAGRHAGTNDIQSLLGHCLIFEQWEGSSGGNGKSFNYYDPSHDHWRQIWISDSGSIIEFTGEARDGGIFYTAETVDPADGKVTLHKFEFTQNDDGSVRQYWETSTDDGESWNAIWDGHYTRK